MKEKRLLILLIAVIVFASSAVAVSASTAKVDKLTMMTTTSCSMYYSKSSVASNKAGDLRYAEEFTVSSISGSWAKIKYDGKTRYVKIGNLDYIDYTVKTAKAYVRTQPSATSTRVVTLNCSNKLTSYGTKKGSDGKTYIYCETSGGKTGYIPLSSVTRSYVPKMVNAKSKYYKLPFRSSDPSSMKTAAGTIYEGTQVKALAVGSNWTKILYNDKQYYIYTKNTGTVKKYTVNSKTTLLKRANKSSTVLKTLYWNTPVIVTGEYTIDGTKWLRCKSGTTTGFIQSSLLKSNKTMKTTMSAELYNRADTNANIKKRILSGSTVNVLYSGNTWAKVTHDGTTGYMKEWQLENAKYYLNGKAYTSSKNMYSGTSPQTVSGEVELISSSKSKTLAYVKTADNKYYYTKWKYLSDIELNQTVYIKDRLQNLYTSPSTDNDPAVKIPYMAEITLVKVVSKNSTGGWYLIEFKDKEYYIWIDSDMSQITAEKNNYDYKGRTPYHQAVIDLALEICSEWETEYVSSAVNDITASGKHAFDCSGFASYVLNTALSKWNPAYDVTSNLENMYGTTYVQNEGINGEFKVVKIPLEEAEPGDILFFNDDPDDGKELDHCGIYIGNNEFIHCTKRFAPNYAVCLMTLEGEYGDETITAARFIPEKFEYANEKFYAIRGTYLYPAMDFDAEKGRKILTNEAVNVLFSNGTWAYVQLTDGSNEKGYIICKNFNK